MSAQIDLFYSDEIESTRSWIKSQGEEFEVIAAAEVIELRLAEIIIDFQSLRFLHSQSLCMQLLARLQEPSIIAVFKFSGLDLNEFTGLVIWQLGQIRTTLPDNIMRSHGAGRPPKFINASADLFEEAVV